MHDNITIFTDMLVEQMMSQDTADSVKGTFAQYIGMKVVCMDRPTWSSNEFFSAAVLKQRKKASVKNPNTEADPVPFALFW
jgi:hypothetical protein